MGLLHFFAHAKSPPGAIGAAHLPRHLSGQIAACRPV